ncbi:bromodomain-containing factor 1 [Blastomyces parvus]|uniref:Bromodomain-containing factor 1 n=1 Tax=Blastomyces parvus TaxID=2060905 RepID=A0A2B7WL87_9EURO|nr:bromodomain-containing factor 1 [Blastomyces parvus]
MNVLEVAGSSRLTAVTYRKNSGNPTLETKTVAVRLSETMSSEPQVAEEPVATDANKPLSPVVNGNGVIGTAKVEAADTSAPLSPLEASQPKSPLSQQIAAPLAEVSAAPPADVQVSTMPVSQTTPGVDVDLPSAQTEKQAAALEPETTPVAAKETMDVDGLAQAPSEPSNAQPTELQVETEPSPVDATSKEAAGSANESLPPTNEQQPSPPAPLKEEAPASSVATTPSPVRETATVPPQTAPIQTNMPSLSQNTPPSPATTGPIESQAPKSEEPKPEPVMTAPVAEQLQQDQEMVDAPPASPTKVTRERDEDMDEEPAAKRTKTDGTAGDAAPAVPEFKVPELPSVSTGAGSDSLRSEAPLTAKQFKFLVRCVQGLKRVHDSRFFREPVDPVKLNIPNYPLIIKQPMDLRTIEDKLKSGSYTSLAAVVSDFDLMVDNSVTFNGPEHMVSVEGLKLKQSFERHLAKLPGPDEVETSPVQKKAKKMATAPTKTQPARRDSRVAGNNVRPTNATSPTTTFALGPEGLPLIRRDSTTADGRPKRSIHPPKNRDLPYSAKPKKKKYQWELKFCQEVLDELHKKKHESIAIPFYYPVDPVALNIPTYHSIIKKPMDLQTVQTRLQTGQYENAKEMEADVRLIFKNCYKFNIPGDPTYNAGKALEQVFDNKWSQKRRWIEAHEPSSGHQSAGTSENGSESEGEESEEDNDQEKLTQLQKQIAEMSKQVEAITQKKKKTPPSSSKKAGKPKSAKKDSKKGSGTTGGSAGKKDKKSGSKSSKPEKQHWVTYREKQIISHGISSLPEKRMTEALKIIQSNVPGLKDTKEAEIELDIDELPNEVLLVLLRFVKKHAPAAMDIVDEPEPEPVPVVAPPKPKKNKPMSKYEQEARINSIEGTISRFQGGGGGGRGGYSQPIQSVEMPESSDDEDDSEESEEE